MRDGWAVVKLAEIADRKTLKNLSKIDLVFTVSAQRGLITQEEYFTKRVASSNLTNYYVVQPGDYVFNKSYSVDAPFGVIAKNTGNSPGLVSPLYIVFGAKSGIIDRDFLGLGLMSTIFWKSLEGSLKEGGRGHGALNLKVGDFFEALLPLPPLPEQKRIVDLIASVDSYIEVLQQQLESTKRSRNAVLHELLNAGGEDWVETTLDGIADVVMGQSPDGKTYNHEGQGLPFMQGSAEFGEHNPVPEKWCSDPKKIAEPGDLLLSVRAPVGDTNFADQRIAVGRGLSIIRANKLSLNEFIRLVIQIKVSELIASSGGGMFASITGKNLKQFKVNLPPLSEQKRIVEIIKTFDEFIAQTFLTTNEAKELKSGLLSDLLSGEHEIPASYDKVMGAA
jgi:type I restriction enzyme S subunit